jgi:hypothetical protein
MIKIFLNWFTGGVLDRIFDSVDNAVDNETKRQDIKANAINRYAETAAEDRADARKYRFFWYGWSLFVYPLGIWWALVMIDTALPFVDWGIPNIPISVQDKADLIFASMFGSGGLVAVGQAISGAVRRR